MGTAHARYKSFVPEQLTGPAPQHILYRTTVLRLHHGRRSKSHHVRFQGLPGAGDAARRQADPPHLPGPLEAVRRRWAVQRAGAHWVSFSELHSNQCRQSNYFPTDTLQASSTKPAHLAPTGSSSPSTPHRTSHALSSKMRRPTLSTRPESANHSAPAGRRTGSRSSSPSPRTCWRRSTSNLYGTRITRA